MERAALETGLGWVRLRSSGMWERTQRSRSRGEARDRGQAAPPGQTSLHHAAPLHPAWLTGQGLATPVTDEIRAQTTKHVGHSSSETGDFHSPRGHGHLNPTEPMHGKAGPPRAHLWAMLVEHRSHRAGPEQSELRVGGAYASASAPHLCQPYVLS